MLHTYRFDTNGSHAEKIQIQLADEATLDVIGGKWKPLVIYRLKDGTLRFNQIVGKVSPGSPRGCSPKNFANWRTTGSLSEGVPAGPAESGIFAHKKGTIPHPDPRRALRLGIRTHRDDIEFKCEE